MYFIGDQCAHVIADYIEADGGLAERMKEEVGEPEFFRLKIRANPVVRTQVPAGLLEKSQAAVFPMCQVYCRQTQNKLNDKFSDVSGTAEIVIQCTMTGDTIDGVMATMSAAVKCLTDLVAKRRGTLMPGAYMNGAWAVTTEAITPGGRKFIQSSKLVVGVDIKKPERNCK
ncbi:MAG: hypothetical protein IPJ98_08435 [Bryobacterales bacterium]|nr:hypothetical protein [Bryobacterales bacterium]